MKRYFYLGFGAILLLCIGIVYAWSIIVTPIAADYPAWSSAQLSMTFTICMFSFCIGGFLRGIFAEKLSVRITLWCSAILYGVGLCLAANIQNSILLLYLGFGVMGGFATGVVYNTIMSVVTPWFDGKNGLISGILLMGFGFGGFCIGKFYQMLISTVQMQWREIFLFFAIAIFVLLLLAGFLMKTPQTKKVTNSVAERCNDKNGKEMVQNRSFQIYFVWLVALIGSGYMVMGHGKNILLEANALVPAATAATIVGLISIFNGCGRMLFGYLYDRLSYKKTMFLIDIIFCLAILSCGVGLHLNSDVLIGIGFICTGLFFAGGASLNSALVSDFFGKKYYAENFAIVNLNVLISSFGSTLAGVIYDAKGSYSSVMFIMTILLLLATVCTILIKRPQE